MNIPGKRLIVGSAVAVAALGIGGVAYAAGGDPTPEQGYVVVEDGATTPSPSQENGTQENGTREDCPEKNGQGQGEQGQAEQPTQPSEQNPAGNA
ncbi:hypothetical protein [Kribbella shirazensis]|uniref:Uncharacterized protein n=1 Tax=Kribbella shirazensis TaxID=1105143 RepID=A0A7X6A2I0_9ACTN|nr:hypothetical protein [Kribbella shirazensis]NIK59028.1 hypothetical protein [Kribbella shirazensis]